MFSIAAAQSSSIGGEIQHNVRRHCELAELAIHQRAGFIVFPELSLTGYEPTLAAQCAIEPTSKLIEPLIDLSNKAGITIVAGCPLSSDQTKPYLGALIIRPGQKVVSYRKRFLHPGEENHFIPSDDTVVIAVQDHRIGIAICADIDNELHPEAASRNSASIYAAGVAMTPGGIEDAHRKMSLYAKRFRMLTVMSNYASETGGFAMAGRSAIWNKSGQTIAQAKNEGECLVIADQSDKWLGRVVLDS